MRIALVSTPFVAVPPRGYGGTELVVAELQRELTRSGHQVTLFATGDSEGEDVRFVFERPVWPPQPLAEATHARFAADEIASGGFDVVHGHVPALVAHAGALGAPLVYTVHHAREERLSAAYRDQPQVAYVAISRRQAELEHELACAVVHHGLDPERHPAGRGEGGHAVFVGRLSWCKAPDMAVAAARAAGMELVVAGTVHPEPEDPPSWARYVERLLAAPGVRHVGCVRGHKKMELLGDARALLMPLRWEEPFGLVMIEAMLCGTPVVAFRRGSAPEIVEHGVTGYLVDDVWEMADALRRVGAIDRTGCRRRARERFSAARMARDYLRVYQAALAASPRWRTGGMEEETYAAP